MLSYELRGLMEVNSLVDGVPAASGSIKSIKSDIGAGGRFELIIFKDDPEAPIFSYGSPMKKVVNNATILTFEAGVASEEPKMEGGVLKVGNGGLSIGLSLSGNLRGVVGFSISDGSSYTFKGNGHVEAVGAFATASAPTIDFQYCIAQGAGWLEIPECVQLAVDACGYDAGNSIMMSCSEIEPDNCTELANEAGIDCDDM